MVPSEPEAKARFVRTLFGRIAPRYDLMNRLMTLGQDQRWRRLAARLAAPTPGGLALDVATGTGDLALALLEETQAGGVVGLDFAQEMLALGRGKARAVGERRIRFIAGDALVLPFRDGSFACVTSAFLLRNLVALDQGLREMRRVLRIGGTVVSLETSPLQRPIVAPLFRLYFHHVVPLLGGLVSGNREAYRYLPQSTDRFLDPESLASAMERAGFRDVTYRELSLGTVVIHVGRVP